MGGLPYQGTDNDDIIDQEAQGISSGPIYGNGGNDRITFSDGLAIGGAGHDTIIATSRWATAAYWDSPRGVTVNLALGTAEDGFGTVDTLVNVRSVQGSSHDDLLIGSTANENFYGGWGSNRVIGGGGYDTYDYYFEKSTSAEISYDAATDTFTVVKHFANGDRGTDTLTGIARIQFTGEGADEVVVLRSNYVGDFRGPSVPVQFPLGASLTQLRTGDFNGDGHADFVLVGQVGTGTANAPSYILLGDGQGNLRDGTAEVFGAAPMKIIGGGRTLVADFNGDGIDDIFQLDFGDDAEPFLGGINSLYLSNSATGKLEDASDRLPQRLDLNHGGAVGDVNGDGHIDVLVNTLDDGNFVLLNDGNGNFTESRALIYPDGPVETSTFSGLVDVNGDGALDAILGTWDANGRKTPTKIVLNDGRGGFLINAPVALPAAGLDREIVLDVDAIDLNGDDLPDLMLSITNGGEHDVFYRTSYIQLLVNDGTGHYRDETASRLPQSKQANGLGWYMSLTSIDVNNDGFADILAESASADLPSKVFLNRGDGTFELAWESEPGERIQAADMNGDGMLDFVVSNGGYATVLPNTRDNGHIYQGNFGGSTLRGSSGDDVFRVRDGSNRVDGGAGFDTAVVPGVRADYAAVVKGNVVLLDGVRTDVQLADVERIHFADEVLALDRAGVAGQAYRIYQAAFDRAPDATGLGFWIGQMDAGVSLTDVAQQFASSAEFIDTYGELDDHAFLSTIYRNVLHRAPDDGGLAFWEQYMDNGGSRAVVLAEFSESPENQDQVAPAIADGIPFVPFFF